MKRKETKQLLPVIQAYAEGKTIQTKRNGDWYDMEDDDVSFCWLPEKYRIKPEETYRPYKDCDEMIADFKKRSNNVSLTPTISTLPTIWIRDKGTEDVFMITGFMNANCRYYNNAGVYAHDLFFDFEELFNNFTYLDDTVCGVRE